MKNQLTKPLLLSLISATLLLVSCQKRKAEKDLYGVYSRNLPSVNYTDSTTQLLLTNEAITFSNGGEVGEIIIGGSFGSNVYYTTEKSDDSNFDLELKLSNLNYSDWLPKNWVTGQGGISYNGVVPNTAILDQVRYYVKVDDNSVQFVFRYPNEDVVQIYARS